MPNVEIPTIDQINTELLPSLTKLFGTGKNIRTEKSTEANAELEKSQLDSEIYTLRERVNNLYFGILLMKEQINQLGILRMNFS